MKWKILHCYLIFIDNNEENYMGKDIRGSVEEELREELEEK